MSDRNISISSIGYVQSRFQQVEGMPIQSVAAYGEKAVVVLLPEYEAGLQGIEGFDYIYLITHLHKVEKELLVVKPFLDDMCHGIFATRSPVRPNKLGMSIVKLTKRDGLHLFIAGNDMLDGTPVIDIKPYVPQFDHRHTNRIGWYEERINRLNETKADGRMHSNE